MPTIMDMYNRPYPRRDAKCCVGKGWAELIDEIYDLLESSSEDVIVTLIKKKYGGLRFYYSGPLQDEVDAICDRSYTVCERCGEPGEPTPGPWVSTLCKSCWKKNNV